MLHRAESHHIEGTIGHGSSAEYRHVAAYRDQARISAAHGGRQGPLHVEGKGVRGRLLGWRPPLRLWRGLADRRPVGTRRASGDVPLWGVGERWAALLW